MQNKCKTVLKEMFFVAIKSLSIRIDDKMLNKLHYVADYEGRSANSQILVLIRDCIEKFEEKNGPILEESKAENPIKPTKKN